MKNALTLFLVILIIPIFGFTQSLEKLDYISPFHDGVSAIKKGNQWAFINQSGDIVVNFRNDLVLTNTDDGNYPIFFDERCLIENKKDGISYFGYIDTLGKTVIEPQFLNANNFINGLAIALKLDRKVLAQNTALGKDLVNYKYYQVTINTKGEVKDYLTQDGVNVVIDNEFLREPPKINSKRISDTLFAIKDENGKWVIFHINQ